MTERAPCLACGGEIVVGELVAWVDRWAPGGLEPGGYVHLDCGIARG